MKEKYIKVLKALMKLYVGEVMYEDSMLVNYLNSLGMNAKFLAKDNDYLDENTRLYVDGLIFDGDFNYIEGELI